MRKLHALFSIGIVKPKRIILLNGVVNLQDFDELKYVLLYDCKKKKKKEEKTEIYSYITIRIFEEYNMSSRSET